MYSIIKRHCCVYEEASYRKIKPGQNLFKTTDYEKCIKSYLLFDVSNKDNPSSVIFG